MRSVAWFITAYFLCALAGWCNVVTVPVEPDLIFYIHGMYNASARHFTEVDWNNLDQATLKFAPFGNLMVFSSLVQSMGAVLCGVLFGRVGARACYVLSLTSAVVHFVLRYNAVRMRTLYCSKLAMLLQHCYLVTRTLVIQEASEESRTSALAHSELAFAVGTILGLRTGLSAIVQVNLWDVAIAPGLLSLVALPLTLILTHLPSIEKNPSTPRLKACQSGSLLPAPATALGWATGREGLVGLVTQPVLALLVVAKVVDTAASGLQDHSLKRMQATDFKTLFGYEPNFDNDTSMVRFLAMLLLVGPCARRFTPRSFILICTLLEAVASFSVAAAFSSLNPLAGFLPKALMGHFLHAVILSHHLASCACGTLLTTLLASAVVTEERGIVLGLDTALLLLPAVVSPLLSSVLLDKSGVSGAYGVSFVLYLGLWLAMSRYILPRYHEKEG